MAGLKASELIKALQGMIEEHGDLIVEYEVEYDGSVEVGEVECRQHYDMSSTFVLI